MANVAKTPPAVTPNHFVGYSSPLHDPRFDGIFATFCTQYRAHWTNFTDQNIAWATHKAFSKRDDGLTPEKVFFECMQQVIFKRMLEGTFKVDDRLPDPIPAAKPHAKNDKKHHKAPQNHLGVLQEGLSQMFVGGDVKSPEPFAAIISGFLKKNGLDSHAFSLRDLVHAVRVANKRYDTSRPREAAHYPKVERNADALRPFLEAALQEAYEKKHGKKIQHDVVEKVAQKPVKAVALTPVMKPYVPMPLDPEVAAVTAAYRNRQKYIDQSVVVSKYDHPAGPQSYAVYQVHLESENAPDRVFDVAIASYSKRPLGGNMVRNLMRTIRESISTPGQYDNVLVFEHVGVTTHTVHTKGKPDKHVKVPAHRESTDLGVLNAMIDRDEKYQVSVSDNMVGFFGNGATVQDFEKNPKKYKPKH